MVIARVRVIRGLGWAVFAAGGMLVIGSPHGAPIAVLVGLATCAWPLGRAWDAARGTALRPSIVWAGLAVIFGILAQACALAEPLGPGRPWAGHCCYLSVLTVLGALISVLNARTPGGGAWAILMVLLVLVFLIPWLEGPGIARPAQGAERLRLNAPWTIFYGLLVIAGVTNYLPTRYGPAACWIGLGLVLEYLALTRPGWPASRRALTWSAVPWTLSVALWSAYGRSGRRRSSEAGLGRLWFWFRDHWGVVWALRVQERFNRSAETQRWPIRIQWHGVISACPSAADEQPAVPEAAEATFRTLVRRFAEPGRLAEAEAGTCQRAAEQR